MRARLVAIALATIGVLTTFASTGASAQGTPLFAVLNGVNECNGTAVPNPLTCRIGDTDGYGSATILFPSTTQVCFGIAVDNIGNVTGAHIHTGSTGVNGGIVVNMSPPAGLGNPRAWAGCVAAAAATVSAIKANPTAFYINVHTTGAPAPAFPNGAIRGQLF
jgi:CHRD domain